MLPTTNQHWIALLGRRDEPTDALEDYCNQLAAALRKRGTCLDIVRIPWDEKGWCCALSDLNRRLPEWHGSWLLVQYTALAWSRRGIPVGFVSVIRRLKRAGLRILIVFHDPDAFGGERLRDLLRRRAQLAILRRVSQLADKVVTTVSPECVTWMHSPATRPKTLFVPVGSNITAISPRQQLCEKDILGVIVFGFSHFRHEAEMLASVVSRVSEHIGPLRLIVFGRGARIVEGMLRPRFAGGQVRLEAFGIVESEQVGHLFSGADVQLFIRSGLSSRRGSGIAGIACGMPVVGFSDAETAFPITEAGVRLVPSGDVEGLVRELVSVLQQPNLRETLRRRSLVAAEQYFSWDRIAETYLSALTDS